MNAIQRTGFGQTNPNFSPGVTSTTAGPDLLNAGDALLNYFDNNGVPPMTTPDSNVSAFQSTWNADPGNSGTNQQLSVDGEYGPNTFSAFSAIVGSVAQPVNNSGGRTAPRGGGGSSTSTTTITASTASFVSAIPGGWWTVAAVAFVGAALVYESAGHHVGPMTHRATRGMHHHARRVLHRRGRARRK